MKIFIAFFILLITNSLSAQTNTTPAEVIVDKHINAIGGFAAFDSIQTLVREGTENYFGKVETIKITYEKDRLFRLDAEYKGQKGYWMVSKTEGGEHFPWESTTPVKFSRFYLQTLQGNLNPSDVLMNYKKDSTQLMWMGRDTVNKTVCHKIKLVSKKRRIIRLYWIDESTYMILRAEKYYFLRNKSLDKLKAVDRFDFSDYRQVGNIKLPYVEKFKTYVNKVIVGEKESLFSKIEINQAINPMLYQISPGMEVTSSDYEPDFSDF